MKLKRKLLAGLLTLCMAVGMAVPAFAAGDPLTISFYYGGAEYGYYQMGWVDVGDIDTDAGRFYATRTIGHVENPGDEPVYTTIEGDINPADKSISSIEPDITMAHLYYDVEVADASSFTVPLPDGPEYRPEGAGFYYTFAAWMVKDGKGGYKALKGSVTAEDVRNAIETDESGNKSVVITAAFHSEIVDKDDLTNKTPSGEYPKYAVILRANGGTFAEDGSDHLYIKPQSMEFSGQDDFFVEATCPKPENGDMVFAGWYRDEACTDGPITYLSIYNDLKDEPYGAAPYAPIDLYAKWESKGAESGTTVKDLTASDTNVSISLTNGVPEGATLSADTIAQESVLSSRPELKEQLPGLLSIYDISVRKDGKALEIRDNPMTVKIPMNDHLKGYKYYQAVYLGDPLERFDAVVEGDFLVFETDHLSQYAILGSNTPFETSEKPTDPDELPFQDVRNGDWFYDSAKYVYGHGLMTGLNDTTFGPGEPLARAQLAVILYRLSGSPEVTYEDIFPDVPDGQWYTDAVIWAQEKGIVTGYSDSGTFKPGNNINRQEITTMMYRYAKYQGYSLEGGADYSSYPDAANVQEFAKDSMSWAVGNGIVTGKENPTRLDPLGNTARAECATIMMRFVEKFGK